MDQLPAIVERILDAVVATPFRNMDWAFAYAAVKWTFIALDLAMLFGIVWYFRKAESYGLKIDLRAAPPTVAEILKRSGLKESYRARWEKLLKEAAANPPASYNTAVLNADALVDELLQEIGVGGANVAERFARLQNLGLAKSAVQDLFRAHRVRNRVAHESQFGLTAREGERTLAAYAGFLREAKILE